MNIRAIRITGLLKRMRRHPRTVSGHLDGSRRYRISPHVRASASGGQIVVLDTKAGQFYLCDGMKALLWSRLTNGDTMEAISAAATESSGAQPIEVRTALEEFITELSARNLIVPECASRPIREGWLLWRAVWELIAYDLRIRALGFRRVYEGLLKRQCSAEGQGTSDDMTTRVVTAIAKASSFYWRPVRCLQRSVATTRLLRSYGVPAHLIIGYRVRPFLSHAWVEVSGCIVNDSPILKDRLLVLDRT